MVIYTAKDRTELLTTTGQYEGESVRQEDIDLTYTWDPSILLADDNGGTVLYVSNGGWRASFTGPILAKWFGVVGDDGADQTSKLQALLSLFTDKDIVINAGNYLVSSSLDVVSYNRKVYGVGEVAIINKTTTKIFNILETLNSVFENIKFKIDNNVSAPHDAAVTTNNGAVDGLEFIRCHFTGPTSNSNGVKIIATTSNSMQNIKFEQCKFANIGRMGIEAQSVISGTAYGTLSDITVENCYFENVGIIEYSIGVSFISELATNCKAIRNRFNNCKLGIELNSSFSLIDGNYGYNYPDGGRLISGTSVNASAGRMLNCIITNNTDTAPINGNTIGLTQLYKFDGLLFSNNNLHTLVEVKDTMNSKFSNSIITSNGSSAVRTAGECINNGWENLTLDSRTASNNYTVFRTDGVDVDKVTNVLVGCTLLKSNGEYNASPADEPTYVKECFFGSDLITDTRYLPKGIAVDAAGNLPTAGQVQTGQADGTWLWM